MGNLSAESLLVVGATSEIGTAVAHSLIKEGARIALSGRSQEKLLAIKTVLGHQIATIACDLTDTAARHELLNRAAGISGRFSGLVYVAGHHRLIPLGPGYSKGLAEHLALNLQAPLDLIRAFVSRKISDESRQRSITIITSIAHRLGEPALSAYSASKGAMVSAARALAVELARKNIRINTISPGWIIGDSALRISSQISETRLAQISAAYPLGLGTPDDVACAVAYLASPAARWVTGIDLIIDGGRTCV